MRTLPRGVCGLVVLTGLMLTAAGALTVMAPAPSLADPGAIARPTTYAEIGVGVATVLLLAAAALVALGAAAWFGRPGAVLAIVGTWAAAAWLAPELAGSPGVPREIRSLALLLAPFMAPLAIHLPLRTLGADMVGRAARVGLVAFYVFMATTAIGHAATWDPFRVIDCAPVCRPGDNIFAVHVDIAASSRFLAAGLAATLAAGLALVGWGAARFGRGVDASRRGDRSVPLAAAVFGSCLAWWAAARLLIGTDARRDPGLLGPAIGTGLALAVMGLTVTWRLVDEMRRREALGRLADLTAGGSGPETMEKVLTRTLGDSSVRVVYPLPDGGHADAHGTRRDAPSSSMGRAIVTIERDGQVVAIVEHDARPAAGLAADPLIGEIGAAARLAVDNERLEATLRAQLHDLQESRARIVAVGDAARNRLERNLHDGAQQRLLAVSYELRLARASADDAAMEWSMLLDDAITRLDQTLLELRDLAHGIYPAVLSEAGLEAALLSLAEEAPIALELGPMPDERYAPAVEAAAYFTVVEALRHAAAAAVGRLDVVTDRVDGWLGLTVAAVGLDGPSSVWMRVDDRVGAAGGRTFVSTSPTGVTELRVELPCG